MKNYEGTIFVGDSEVRCKYDYFAGQRAITAAPAEQCQEGMDPSVTITEVYWMGEWIPYGFLGLDDVDTARNEQDLLDQHLSAIMERERFFDKFGTD
jgi:hypothetical protein